MKGFLNCLLNPVVISKSFLQFGTVYVLKRITQGFEADERSELIITVG